MNDYLLRILRDRAAEFMPVLMLTAVLFFGWFQPAWSQSSSQPERTDAVAPQHGQPLKPEDSSNGMQPGTGADVSVKPSNVETEKKKKPPATPVKSSRLKETVPVSGVETQTRVELPVIILEQWENRIEALLDHISTGKKEREQADILYGELFSVLLAKHQSLKDAISQRTLNEAIENLHAEVNGLYDMRGPL